jgi:hypothetical protein
LYSDGSTSSPKHFHPLADRGVSDLERSKAFYDKALKAIGIELYSEGAEFFGYGAH